MPCEITSHASRSVCALLRKVGTNQPTNLPTIIAINDKDSDLFGWKETPKYTVDMMSTEKHLVGSVNRVVKPLCVVLYQERHIRCQ